MSLFNRYKNVARGMKRSALFVGAVALAALLLSTLTFVPTYAQLQQSGGGGSNASVGSFAAAAPGSGTAVGGVFNSSLPTYTNGQLGQVQIDANGRLIVASIAGALPTGANTIGGISNTGFNVTGSLPAGTNSIGTVVLGAGSASVGTVGLNAGSNLIGVVYAIPKTACGSTVFSLALAAVPTATTAVATATTCVVAIVINNTNSSSGTVTVSDNQGTPINDILTFTIPANSQLVQPLHGVQFTSGIKWNASTTGFTGALIGYQ